MILSIALVLVSNVFWLATSNPHDSLAPKHTINLDLPPYERFQELGVIYADKWPVLLKQIGSVMNTSEAGMRMSYIYSATMFNQLNQPYRDELLGFAVAANRTIGEVIVFNFFFDIFSHKHSNWCTSIVAEEQSGGIIHGRNFDHFFDVLREMAVVLEFKRNNKIVYTGTSFAGFFGLMTGQKAYKFTVSYDARVTGTWQLNDWAAAFIGAQGFISFLVRDVFDKANSFRQAIDMFSHHPLIAPCYFIVGGTQPGEGVVITRGRWSTVDLWWLKPKQGRWYLVETNYDHWTSPPSIDKRRAVAKRAMNHTGRANINPTTLFKVLSTPPVLNFETIHTTIMSAAHPLLYTTVIRSKRT